MFPRGTLPGWTQSPASATLTGVVPCYLYNVIKQLSDFNLSESKNRCAWSYAHKNAIENTHQKISTNCHLQTAVPTLGANSPNMVRRYCTDVVVTAGPVSLA